MWSSRTVPNTVRSVRTISSKAPPKVRILEKPTQFNPPSHGSKLRKEAPRYPGPRLSAEEQATQKTKQYPNTQPPDGTFLHWFLNNRSIHMYITMVCNLHQKTWPHTDNKLCRELYSPWPALPSLQILNALPNSQICYHLHQISFTIL